MLSHFWLGFLYMVARTASLGLVLLGVIQISLLLVGPAPSPPEGTAWNLLWGVRSPNAMP